MIGYRSKDSAQIRIVKSKITNRNNHAAGAGFRNWHHITANVKLTPNGTPQGICLDTGYTITVADRQFVKQYLP